jgi:hypothetical protein
MIKLAFMPRKHVISNKNLQHSKEGQLTVKAYVSDGCALLAFNFSMSFLAILPDLPLNVRPPIVSLII